MATKNTEEKAASPATKNTEKKVTIKLPLTRTEKDDVYVAVNGHSYQIKRGVAMEVPASVAEVLQHSEEMLAESMAHEATVALSEG